MGKRYQVFLSSTYEDLKKERLEEKQTPTSLRVRAVKCKLGNEGCRKKRPTKKVPLINWIKSQCNHIKPKVSPEKIYKELIVAGNIIDTDSKLTYR